MLFCVGIIIKFIVFIFLTMTSNVGQCHCSPCALRQPAWLEVEFLPQSSSLLPYCQLTLKFVCIFGWPTYEYKARRWTHLVGTLFAALKAGQRRKRGQREGRSAKIKSFFDTINIFWSEEQCAFSWCRATSLQSTFKGWSFQVLKM